jgi:hypothetical protein
MCILYKSIVYVYFGASYSNNVMHGVYIGVSELALRWFPYIWFRDKNLHTIDEFFYLFCFVVTIGLVGEWF